MTTTTSTGGALRRARELAGLSVGGAARRMGIAGELLRAWETGQLAPSDEQVEVAARLYGNDLAHLWPERTPMLDPEQPGVAVIGTETIDVGPDEFGRRPANSVILTRYIDAVRRQRGLEPHERFALRGADIAALSTVLDLDDARLEDELQRCFDLTPIGSRMTVKAMAIAALMALAATGVVGGSWLAPDTAEDHPTDVAFGAPTTTAVAPADHAEGYLTVDPPEVSSVVEERPSPFSTEAAEPVAYRSIFSIDPVEVPARSDEGLFSTDPAEGTPGVIVEADEASVLGPSTHLGLPTGPTTARPATA